MTASAWPESEPWLPVPVAIRLSKRSRLLDGRPFDTRHFWLIEDNPLVISAIASTPPFPGIRVSDENSKVKQRKLNLGKVHS